MIGKAHFLRELEWDHGYSAHYALHPWLFSTSEMGMPRGTLIDYVVVVTCDEVGIPQITMIYRADKHAMAYRDYVVWRGNADNHEAALYQIGYEMEGNDGR